MRLVTFTDGRGTRIGAAADGRLVDLAAAAPALPRTMEGFLAAGAEAMDTARRATAGDVGWLPQETVRLEAPVRAPRKFLGIGLNYRAHVAELKEAGVPIQMTPHQTWFNKQVSCIGGPADPIWKPAFSDQLDYEGELAIVIGRRCRHVPAGRAHEVIAGYTVTNDVSVRDWQLRAPTATLGKSFDTHGPLGPWIVTPDELPHPDRLTVRTFVNGEPRQNGCTDDMVHAIPEMIAELSRVFTLEPGDVLATGSPPGVGALMKPPRFLAIGDVVRVEIEGIGAIENRVVAEPVTAWMMAPPVEAGATPPAG